MISRLKFVFGKKQHLIDRVDKILYWPANRPCGPSGPCGPLKTLFTHLTIEAIRGFFCVFLAQTVDEPKIPPWANQEFLQTMLRIFPLWSMTIHYFSSIVFGERHFSYSLRMVWISSDFHLRLTVNPAIFQPCFYGCLSDSCHYCNLCNSCAIFVVLLDHFLFPFCFT